MYKGEVGVVSCSPSLCNAAAPSTPINTASDAAGVTARAPLFLRTAPGSVEPGRMTAGCRALHTLGEERGGWEGRHTHCPWSASMQSDSAFTKAIPELAPVRPRGRWGEDCLAPFFKHMQPPATNCHQLRPPSLCPPLCVQRLSGIGPRAISGGCGATSPLHH